MELWLYRWNVGRDHGTSRTPQSSGKDLKKVGLCLFSLCFISLAQLCVFAQYAVESNKSSLLVSPLYPFWDLTHATFPMWTLLSAPALCQWSEPRDTEQWPEPRVGNQTPPTPGHGTNDSPPDLCLRLRHWSICRQTQPGHTLQPTSGSGSHLAQYLHSAILMTRPIFRLKRFYCSGT